VVLTGGGPSVVLAEEVLVVVLASEVLCMEPVGEVPTVVRVLDSLIRLVYPIQGQLDYVGGP
jgi:hypothetical protein